MMGVIILQFSSATMIAQPTLNTRLQDDVGYKSLHVVHCKHVLLSGIEHHCGSDVVETMQPECLI